MKFGHQAVMVRVEMLDHDERHAARRRQSAEKGAKGPEPPAEAPKPTTGKSMPGFGARLVPGEPSPCETRFTMAPLQT